MRLIALQTNFGDFEIDFKVFGYRLSEWFPVLLYVAILGIPLVFCAFFRRGWFRSRMIPVSLICLLSLAGVILLGMAAMSVAMATGFNSSSGDNLLWTTFYPVILWLECSLILLLLAIGLRPRSNKIPKKAGTARVLLPNTNLPKKRNPESNLNP
jgi:hypothetical protein